METKQQSTYMEEKMIGLNFQHHFYVNPIGRAGGLALWWTAGLPIRIISSDRYYVHVFICIGVGFFCTFVHAPSESYERRAFWDVLSSLTRDKSQPWMVVGDCNTVCYAHEKQGRNLIRYSSVQPFKDFIDNNSLMDMGCIRNIFIWTNMQQGDDLVKARLDRALCTTEFRVHFENAKVYNEEMIGSDHAPIRVLLSSNARTKAPFRFDKRWIKKAECEDIIRRSWSSGGMCESRLRSCQTGLTY
ncbi:hypothetical protein LINPERHAP2_LOCUS24237 [Linum perenne]